MILRLWDWTSPISANLPDDPIGVALLAIGLLLLLILNVLHSWAFRARPFAGLLARPVLFTGLLLAGLASTGLLVVHWNFPSGGLATQISDPTFPPTVRLLSALPWLLAAGLLGTWEASLIGLATGTVLTVFAGESWAVATGTALQAASAAILIRQNFRELPAQIMRIPVAAALLSAVVFTSWRAFALFLESQAPAFTAFDIVVSWTPAVFLSAGVEVLVAGAAVEIYLRLAEPAWSKPKVLVLGPYNRSLTARVVSSMLILGVLVVAVLATGQWVMAREAVRELVAEQMVRTASQAAQGIPFFIQSGRRSIREMAIEMQPLFEEGAETESADPVIGPQVFFSRIAVFDSNGGLVAGDPSLQEVDLDLDLAVGLEAAYQGIPSEIMVAPDPGDSAARMAFLAPVFSASATDVNGAVIGWTDLGENPLIAPILNLLADPPMGSAYLIDERGVVLYHPTADLVMTEAELPADLEAGQVELVRAASGATQLQYLHDVPGYAWQIVMTVPRESVDELAMPIATRLLGVLALVGAVFLMVIFVSSRRLTRPLEVMSGMAESMARGTLEHSVPLQGEDEIGRLAGSFEHMRLSLKKRLEELQLLLHVSQRLAGNLDLESSLLPLLASLRSLTGAVVLRLSIDPQGSLSGLPLLGISSSEQGSAEWSRLDPQILDIARERGEFALENPSRARAILNVDQVGAAVEALAAFPIQHEESFAAALWMAYSEPHNFTQEERNLLSIVAAQIGVWLANVYLLHVAQQERRRLAAVLASTPDAVLMVDNEDRIVLTNPAASAVLSGSREEAQGKPISGWIDPPELLELLQSNESNEPVEIPLQDGSVLSGLAKDIHVGDGIRAGRVAVLWDITHYKKLDMLKSEFVSTVSHDLRAPLTLMRGYATMMSMVGALTDQQKEFVSKILATVDGMAELVENLLDLGRIDAGLGLSLQSVDVAAVIEDVVKSFRPNAVNKRQTLEVQLEDSLPEVEADATLLRQALANLVDNAIKYTPAGGEIYISAGHDPGSIWIVVEDTGLGVAPADKARLFERFYRARRKETLREKGSGLGLAIVKSIVEQHGGSVTLESRLGEGSRFMLEIPTDRMPAD